MTNRSGMVRISHHFYNTKEEIDLVAEILKQIIEEFHQCKNKRKSRKSLKSFKRAVPERSSSKRRSGLTPSSIKRARSKLRSSLARISSRRSSEYVRGSLTSNGTIKSAASKKRIHRRRRSKVRPQSAKPKWYS